MKYTKIYLLIALAALLVSCEDQIKVKEIWTDRYIDQKLDTVRIIDNWFLDGQIIRTAEDIENTSGLLAMNLFLDGNEIYIANKQGKSIDVFDAETMNYKRSFSYDGKTLAQDVYVQGDQVFVATGEMCAIQIFNKKDGKYITRLGTGIHAGNVSKSGCVAANNDFVFVRDSKYQDIRVFERSSISAEQENNNTVYARLSTKGYYIASPSEPLTGSYEMTIANDSLYAFIHCSGLILSYSIKDVRDMKNDTPVTKTQLAGGMKIYSASTNSENGNIWLSMEKSGQKEISEFKMEDFIRREFSKPIRSFTSNDRYSLPSQPMFSVYKESIIYLNGNSIEKWEIKNNPSYIIEGLE